MTEVAHVGNKRKGFLQTGCPSCQPKETHCITYSSVIFIVLNTDNHIHLFTDNSYTHTHTHTHTHPFNDPLSGTTRVSRYQKGKTNLDFAKARDSELQWHQLGHMQVCTSLLSDNHASTPPLSFLEAGCPSCCQTKSVKAPKAH